MQEKKQVQSIVGMREFPRAIDGVARLASAVHYARGLDFVSWLKTPEGTAYTAAQHAAFRSLVDALGAGPPQKKVKKQKAKKGTGEGAGGGV